MKKFKRAFLFLPFVCLMILASCSQQEDLLANEAQVEPTVAMGPGTDVLCCAECGDGCLIGYEYQANVSDPAFPQGGYKVGYIDGDCDCEWGPNGPQVITTGYTEWSYGFTGGPGGGAACGAPTAWLMSELFPGNGGCSGSWVSSTGGGDPDPGYIGGTFGQFSEEVRQHALTYNDPNDVPIIGLLNWPASWAIAIEESINNRINVTLPTGAPALQLRRVGIFPQGAGPAVTYVTADGSTSYQLDMSSQPAGSYTVKMDFWPGFHLIQSIENVAAPRGK